MCYLVLVTLLITLVPFRFYWPSQLRLLWVGGWFDAACNLLLFLPLGFLYRLARQPQAVGRLRSVFFLGLAASAGIEGLQLFLPGRYASPVDVLMNGVGALIGAWLCDRAKRFVDRRWAGKLALELPLTNIVYLLAPLIWLNGLAAGGDRRRCYLSWALGVCGSAVLAGVYRYGLRQTGRLPALLLCLGAAAWFVASSLPAFLVSPSIPLGGALLVVLAVGALLVSPNLAEPDQRRFEIPVLKQVFPPYAAFLVLLFFWPLPSRYAAWRGSLELIELADRPGVLPVLRLVEHFAAFTLLGYMVAELTGRRDTSRARSLGWSTFWCGLACATLELARGFHPHHFASLSQGLLALTGSIYGCVIYWLQLASVRQLQGRSDQHRIA